MSGQVWSVAGEGGYMYSDQLSDHLRMVLLPTVKFRQFCDPGDHSSKGHGTGDKFYWNVYSKVATAGAALSENAAMPESKITVTQANGTVTEYGKMIAAVFQRFVKALLP